MIKAMTITGVDIVLSRYAILLLVVVGLLALLYWWGFFKFAKNVAFDCLMDHTTGRYTINNLARFLSLFAFLFLFISVHFNVRIKPHFQIYTVPFSEWELGIVLAFIIGAEWVKKKPDQPTYTNPEEYNGKL